MITACAAIALCQLFILSQISVDIPINDDWGVVSFIKAYAENGDWPGLLLGQANEHRIPLLRLVAIANYHYGNLDLRIHHFLIWVVEIMTLILLLVYLHRQHLARSMRGKSVVLAISIITFNWFQFRYIVGTRYTLHACGFFALAAFYLAARSRGVDRAFFGAAGCALAAAFSMLNGLLVWPIIAGMLAIQTYPRRATGVTAFWLWLALSVGAGLLYFPVLGFSTMEHHPSALTGWHQPLLLLNFFFIMLGTLVSDLHLQIALVAGILLGWLWLAAVITACRTGAIRAILFPLAVGLFGLGTCLMTSIGRCGFGLNQTTEQRYTVYSGFIIISLLLMLLHLTRGASRSHPGRRVAVVTLSAVIVAAVAVLSGHSLVPCLDQGQQLRRKQQLLLSATSAGDRTQPVPGPVANSIDNLVRFLKARRLSCFNQ